MKQVMFLPLSSPEANKTEENKENKKPRKKRLNDLTAKEWIKFSKSWFTLKRGGSDREKIKAHPATFPAELAESYIGFFTKQGEWVLDPFPRFRHNYGNSRNIA